MRRHQLTQVEANMRMGSAILRFYLARRRNDVRRALARYNGSVGRREYPDKVVHALDHATGMAPTTSA